MGAGEWSSAVNLASGTVTSLTMTNSGAVAATNITGTQKYRCCHPLLYRRW